MDELWTTGYDFGLGYPFFTRRGERITSFSSIAERLNRLEAVAAAGRIYINTFNELNPDHANQILAEETFIAALVHFEELDS